MKSFISSYMYDDARRYDTYSQMVNHYKGGPLQLEADNNILQKQDWTREPEPSIVQLAETRIKQLKESCEYIRLFYSGGSDSSMILKLFLFNGIVPDEIVMYRQSPIDDFENSYYNQDLNKDALPQLKNIQRDFPQAKINILDIGSKQYHQFFDSKRYMDDDFYFTFSWRAMCLLEPELLFDDYEKPDAEVTNLLGLEKPKLSRRNGEWFVRLNHWETIATPHTNFFTSSKSIPLMIKQAHLAKNFLEIKYPDESEDKFNFVDTNPTYRRYLQDTTRLAYVRHNELDKGRNAGKRKSKKTETFMKDAKENKELYDKYKEMMEYFFSNPEAINDNLGLKNARVEYRIG